MCLNAPQISNEHLILAKVIHSALRFGQKILEITHVGFKLYRMFEISNLFKHCFVDDNYIMYPLLKSIQNTDILIT